MKIIAVGDKSVAEEVRSFQAIRKIDGMTYKGELWEAKIDVLPPHGGDVSIYDVDVLIYSRPLSYALLQEYRKHGARIIVDVDDDFASIPPSHVAYRSIGPASKVIHEHHKCLAAADYLIFSTNEIASRLHSNRPYTVIPNGWDDKNPNWNSPKRSDGIVIGWGGTPTHREDFKIIIEPLLENLRQHPETNIYIAGDPKIYDLFKEIPEDRKLFFAWMDYETYPLFLRQLDILVAPLHDDHFNRAKSDIKLVEAGAAGIPWLASAVGPYLEWENDKYGLWVANEHHSWDLAINAMIVNHHWREKLGSEGRMHAEGRSFTNLLPLWVDAIAHVMEMRDESLVHLQRQPEGVELQRVESNDPTPSNQQRKRRRHR